MSDFWFEQLEIWKDAIELSDKLFECANILYIFEKRQIIFGEQRSELYSSLIILSKKITIFRKTLI